MSNRREITEHKSFGERRAVRVGTSWRLTVHLSIKNESVGIVGMAAAACM